MKLTLEFDHPQTAAQVLADLLRQTPAPQAGAALDAGASAGSEAAAPEGQVQTSSQGLSAGTALAQGVEASPPPAPHGDTFGLGEAWASQSLEMDAGAGRA